ncbi:hypothetical protein JTB14_031593 [Gonioctena quinquepunctata]|nr:hypothetical protein JTB14_031593 [Gonioctena quinquepunctata]
MTMLMEEGDDLEKADKAEGTNGLEQAQEADIDRERDDIISFLTSNEDICFKNQQRWEADLTTHEKFEIALKIFRENKLNFLMKFGKYLKHEQLGYFEQFKENVEPDSAEIKVVLCELYENVSINASGSKIKNRRYEALKQMVQEDSYFSELEMMKRNPLLYEQLIGQYLTSEEIKERDRYKMDEQVTFVKILMEGIERDNAEICRKEQEEMEDGQMEEEEEDESSSEDGRSSSPVPSTSRWGEFEKHMVHRPKPKTKPHPITEPERKILKEEFITSMYQSFLDGNDLVSIIKYDNTSYTILMK